MNGELNRFLQCWTGGGDVPDAERQRVLDGLREDQEFRTRCVAECRLLGMCRIAQSSTPRWLELTETLGISNDHRVDSDVFALEVLDKATKQGSGHRHHPLWNRQRWRPPAAAAAGLMMGICSASIVWAVARPAPEILMRKVLMKEFESTSLEIQTSFPEEAGIWNGEGAEVAASDTAAEGKLVLRFRPKESRKISHINHIIDVSSLTTLGSNERRNLRHAGLVFDLLARSIRDGA